MPQGGMDTVFLYLIVWSLLFMETLRGELFLFPIYSSLTMANKDFVTLLDLPFYQLTPDSPLIMTLSITAITTHPGYYSTFRKHFLFSSNIRSISSSSAVSFVSYPLPHNLHPYYLYYHSTTLNTTPSSSFQCTSSTSTSANIFPLHTPSSSNIVSKNK